MLQNYIDFSKKPKNKKQKKTKTRKRKEGHILFQISNLQMM
jgi:hypothetical protein